MRGEDGLCAAKHHAKNDDIADVDDDGTSRMLPSDTQKPSIKVIIMVRQNCKAFGRACVHANALKVRC